MRVNIPVPDLVEYLPHRPPMVWVDEVIEAGINEKGIFGVCSVHLKTEALFFSDQQELRASAAIEFTAQAYGFVRAAYQVANKIDNTPKRTFLTMVRQATGDFSALDLSKEKQLLVEVQLIKAMNPLSYVEGKIMGLETGQLFAEVGVQVYAE